MPHAFFAFIHQRRESSFPAISKGTANISKVSFLSSPKLSLQRRGYVPAGRQSWPSSLDQASASGGKDDPDTLLDTVDGSKST